MVHTTTPNLKERHELGWFVRDAAKVLHQNGFERRKTSNTFLRSRGTGIRELISLPFDIRGDEPYVTCNLAIGCSDPASTEPGSVITRNIGYLMPANRWREWLVDRDFARNKELTTQIVQFGLPWLDSFRSTQDVERAYTRLEKFGDSLEFPNRSIISLPATLARTDAHFA